MDQLEALGKIAGIGGIALGVLLLIFRDTVAPNIPNLTKPQAYTLLRTIVVLSFGVAMAGLGAWLWVETHPRADSAAVAAQARQECLEAAIAARREGGGSASDGVISAGGSVTAGRDIRVQGADQLGRPGVTADCGDVTAGGTIGVTAGGGSDTTEQTK